MKKKILFGTGMIAEQLSEYIGMEDIAYFVDNNPSKKGTYYKTKQVISVERLNELADNYEVIVAVGAEHVYEISKQLNGLNINYTCFNEFPCYFVDKNRVILSPADVISNNHLLEMKSVYLWGGSLFARKLQGILLNYNIDCILADCKEIEYDQIRYIIENSNVDAHILCINNDDVHVGKQKAEKIRNSILEFGGNRVVDCFDQDIFESRFYNKEVKKYKNLYVGKRCFIIGNGPSLQVPDLECLYRNGEITFAANQIYRIFDQVKWRPDYYCCVDDLLIKQYIDNIVNVECRDKFLFDYFHYSYGIEKKQNIQYIHIKAMTYETEGPKFSSDISKEIYMGYTVTYAMLQIACYMGFKEIYLIGVDHSDLNKHFFENYVDKNIKTYTYDYGDKAFLAYISAKKYCEKNNVKIYNATRGGQLDVFDRIYFDGLF